MQRVLRDFLVGVLFLGYTISYASFEVDPLHINIPAGEKTAILNIINQDDVKNFTLELRNTRSNTTSSDLEFSPPSFTLLPQQRQLVRIGTKKEINYAGQSYTLHIKTSANKPTSGMVTKFKIPIHIQGTDRLSTSQQLDRNANTAREPENLFDSRNTNGLSQIRITIPVSVTVGEGEN